MKNGIKILGAITEVTVDKVFFKNCDAQSYLSSSIHKKDVNYIHFANHVNDLNLFKSGQIENKKKNGFFIARIVLFILALFCFMIFLLGRNLLSFGFILFLILLTIIFLLALFILFLISLAQP
jgi:hypothetical protein